MSGGGLGRKAEEVPTLAAGTQVDVEQQIVETITLRPSGQSTGSGMTRSRITGSEDGSENHSFASGDESNSLTLVTIRTGCLRFAPGSLTGQRFQMMQMLLLPFIPIVALIIQNSTILSKVVFSLSEAHEIQHQINLTMEVGRLIASLQQERGATAYYIFTNGSRDMLQDNFAETDLIIRNITVFLDRHVLRGKSSFTEHMAVLSARRQKILNLTSQKVQGNDDAALDEMIWYNVANDIILDQLSSRIRETTTTDVWKILIAFQNIIRSIENYSISMVYGLYYFGKGSLSQESFIKYVRFDSLAEDYLNATQSFSSDIMKDYGNFHRGFDFYDELEERRGKIYTNKKIEPNARDGADYYKKMQLYISELRRYQYKLKDIITARIAEEILIAKGTQALAATLLTIVLSISPIIIFLIRNVTRTIQVYQTSLVVRTNAVRREKRKSDKLLSQMLPKSVVKQLRQKRQVPATSYEAATIYFSDIVSFTKLSASSSPMEIVIMLNALYKLFDSRIEHYDVYKVETIGDAYMVVSGLPEPNETRHAAEICAMALDLVDGVRHFEIPHRPGDKLQIRVGVNTGPCVAGVVGTTMPRYCLFGDAINTASRMESTGEPMRIHITQETKTYLDEVGGFTTEPRGTVEIKGKGILKTFWLESKEGMVPRSVELTTPGYFTGPTNYTPEFIKDLFGSEDDEMVLGGPTPLLPMPTSIVKKSSK